MDVQANMRYFWILVEILVFEVMNLTNSQTLNANVLEFDVFGDSDFYQANCWPDRLIDDEFISATTPVLSCNATLFKTLTCDSWVRFDMFAIDKNGGEVSFCEDSDTVGNALKRTNGTVLWDITESIRVCLNLSALCPITGEFKIDKCRVHFSVSSLPISKLWKVSIRFSKQGHEFFGFIAKLALDDTALMRAKRPTAAQRNRRNQKKKGKK